MNNKEKNSQLSTTEVSTPPDAPPDAPPDVVPDRVPPHYVSVNLTLFVSAFIIFVIVLLYFSSADKAANVAGVNESDSVLPLTDADESRMSENRRVYSPVVRMNSSVSERAIGYTATDADVSVDSPSHSSSIELGGVASTTTSVSLIGASVTPSVFSASPKVGTEMTPQSSDPLPPPPIAPPSVAIAAVNPANQVDASGRYAIQSNTRSASVGSAQTFTPTGDLSPKNIAEQAAAQQQKLIYGDMLLKPTPASESNKSYGLTPTPTATLPPIAIPQGLGNWSVTPTPTTADNDLKLLSAMQHLSPNQFVPTPLASLTDKGATGIEADGADSLGGVQSFMSDGMPPLPTPHASQALPTPVAMDSLQTPLPDDIVTNEGASPIASPTPTSPTDAASNDVISNDIVPNDVVPVDSSQDAFSSDSAEKMPTPEEKAISKVLVSPDAVPTVPPNLAQKPVTTPRSGVVVSHGNVNMEATPPADATVPMATPLPTPPPAPTTTPAAANENDVLVDQSSSSSVVSSDIADQIADEKIKQDLKKAGVDPAVARAAEKALDKRAGVDSDGIVPDLTQLPPELAKRLGAGAGLSAQVGDKDMDADSVGKQVDAIIESEGIDPKTSQRDNIEYRLVNDWAERTAIAEMARSDGENVSADEIQAYLDKRCEKAKKVQQVMLGKGISQEDLNREAADAALVDKIVEREFREKYGSEEKLKEIYDNSPELYQPSRSIRVAEIFKPMPQDSDAARAVRDVMENLRKNIADGADFGSVALKESQAPSRMQSGELGWLDASSGKITEMMAEGLADLKPGEVSKVMMGKDGFYIFKLEEIKEPVAGFEGARENVETAVKIAIRVDKYNKAKRRMKVVIGGEPQLPDGVAVKRNAKKAR